MRSSEILREIWEFLEISRELQRVSTGSQGVSKSFREFRVVFGGLSRFLERLRVGEFSAISNEFQRGSGILGKFAEF